MESDPNILDLQKTLRHLISALHYRFAKAVADVPEGYPSFEAGQGTRTPQLIVLHMQDVMRYGLFLLSNESFEPSSGNNWQDACRDFTDLLITLDKLLDARVYEEKQLFRLLQGPIADALTHVGQLAMMRRLAGAPISKENFSKADISVGRIKGQLP